ncbi:hypothetical protein CVT24_008982, partial [Panaeolus cyanescens]
PDRTLLPSVQGASIPQPLPSASDPPIRCLRTNFLALTNCTVKSCYVSLSILSSNLLLLYFHLPIIMRAACNLYEHPTLSSSEVWAKDALNRSGVTRFFSALGGLTVVATVITAAAAQYSGLFDITSLQRK